MLDLKVVFLQKVSNGRNFRVFIVLFQGGDRKEQSFLVNYSLKMILERIEDIIFYFYEFLCFFLLVRFLWEIDDII